MKALTIARLELLRLLRERSNLFFVFVLPLLLVVLIGASFGGASDETDVGVVTGGDPLASALVEQLDEPGVLEVVTYDDAIELNDAVEAGEVTAGVVVPQDLGRSLVDGRRVEVEFIQRQDGSAAAVQPLVSAAVAELSLVPDAVRAVTGVVDVDAGELTGAANELVSGLPALETVREPVGGDGLAAQFAGLEQFDLGASSQLFLFVFLTSLSSGAALIQTRRYGVARRMVSTPTSLFTILAGSAGGRFLVALAQALYIVVATWLAFRVNWGDPVGTTVVVLLFCLVSAGAGMLLGSVAENDAQAGGLGVGLGLILAALGGSMMPLELFPPGMRVVAHLTPHAWANEAMAELVRREGTLADVALEAGVLGVYATVLLGLGTWALRRALTR